MGAPETACKCGCGVRFIPSRQRWRFATKACCERYYNTRPKRSRRERRATKGERHPRTALMWEMRAELDAEGGKGRCIYCVKPLPKGRVLHCGSQACEAAYQHDYHLAEHAERTERKPAPEPRLCERAGCGVRFTPTALGHGRRFCAPECWRKHYAPTMNANRRTAMRKARKAA